MLLKISLTIHFDLGSLIGFAYVFAPTTLTKHCTLSN